MMTLEYIALGVADCAGEMGGLSGGSPSCSPSLGKEVGGSLLFARVKPMGASA